MSDRFGSASGNDALRLLLGGLPVAMPRVTRGPVIMEDIELSNEQQAVVDTFFDDRDIVVDATCGSGKTRTIQQLCNEITKRRPNDNVLYLTYSKLLKEDAQRRVFGAKVTNYHGVVYPYLRNANIKCGISESIKKFNENFKQLSKDFPAYDVLIIDEYQDITAEYAELIRNIKSKNPTMQVVMVGDMEQRVKAASTFDPQAFTKELCNDPVLLAFTQSFRIGPLVADRLAKSWSKPIKGVNTDQKVEIISYERAVTEMLKMSDKVGDILCLGKRNGTMTQLLNECENKRPDAFNKNTVFASVREGDNDITSTPDCAIFTTFDASKGLERDTCFIFDYTEKSWFTRNKFADANPVILRNVFLVAASRGKSRIFYVMPPEIGNPTSSVMRDDHLGFIDINKFINLPAVSRPTYDQPFEVSGMFDFRYVEHVEEAFDLLDVTCLDDGDNAHHIEVERADGLIDLSAVVGHYQEGLFFSGYQAVEEMAQSDSVDQMRYESYLDTRIEVMQAQGRTALDPWDDALVLAAVDTAMERYVTQVDKRIDSEVADELLARLNEHISPEDDAQHVLELEGTAQYSRRENSPIAFVGIADVYRPSDSEIVELKFVNELTHPMFLQVAMYVLMSGMEHGILWNTRTNERWQVEIPDRQRFMDAVTKCVTKGSYLKFVADDEDFI